MGLGVKTRRWGAVMTSAALLLTGCGKSGGMAGVTSLGGLGGRGEQAKLNAYTTALNTLIGEYGLAKTLSNYAEEDVAHKGVTDSTSIYDGRLDEARTELKTARNLPGAMSDVDASADKVLSDLDRVLARMTGLKAYYTSKGFKEDGGARGKAEDPLLQADFKAGVADLDRLNGIVDARRKVRARAELAMLKARGDHLGYDTKLALQEAETVVGLFKTPADLKNPAILAQADAQIALMNKVLADQRQDLIKARQDDKGPNSYRLDNYGRIADGLNKFIGDYRDLKQNGTPQAINSAIADFNDAVGWSNSNVALPGG